MMNLVSIFEYLLLLSFLTATEFNNLGQIQGLLTQKRSFLWFILLSDLIFMSAEKICSDFFPPTLKSELKEVKFTEEYLF